MRAIVSVTPPAGTGTTSFTVPLGKVWAVPLTDASSTNAAPVSAALVVEFSMNTFPRCIDELDVLCVKSFVRQVLVRQVLARHVD
jgi:hypothetical protein